MYKVRDTLGYSPSLPSIRAKRLQILLAFLMFPTTARQSSSVVVKIRLRYRNYETASIGCLYSLNVRFKFSLVSVSASRRRFRSAPFAHCAVPMWRPLSASLPS